MKKIIKEKISEESLGQKEFSCKVKPDDEFDYVLLYVKSINKYLCWKKSTNIQKKEIYNAQQKQVLENQTEGISFFIKGEEYLAWGKEKVYIISKDKIDEFKESLLKDEIDFKC